MKETKKKSWSRSRKQGIFLNALGERLTLSFAVSDKNEPFLNNSSFFERRDLLSRARKF